MRLVLSVIPDLYEYFVSDRLDLFKALSLLHLRQLKDHLLGMIENLRSILFLLKRFTRDLVACTNQVTQHRLCTDDADVIGDVGEMRKPVCKIRYGCDPADRFDRSIFFQFFRDQDRVDLFRGFEKRDHRAEDTAMQRRIKIFWFKVFDRLRDECVIKQNSA